ncbi:MAG: DMT family protein [Nitrospirae bacterium]|nr:DMT family protein [Nitrospirota bacterium]
MRPTFITIILLSLSNIFMTFAWYGHLKHLNTKPWYLAAILSWFVAFFEYLLQVPANRIGYTSLNLPQLKIMQEIITICIFIPFALYYMKQPWKTDYFYAFLCILGAVYFTFKG